MPKYYSRTQRIADTVQRELANLLRHDVSDLRLKEVTITLVKVSPDLAYAKVYFTLLNEQELPEVLAVLKKAAGYLRHLLAQTLNLRVTPQLRFYHDEQAVQAERLIQLINAAVASDRDDQE